MDLIRWTLGGQLPLLALPHLCAKLLEGGPAQFPLPLLQPGGPSLPAWLQPETLLLSSHRWQQALPTHYLTPLLSSFCAFSKRGDGKAADHFKARSSEKRKHGFCRRTEVSLKTQQGAPLPWWDGDHLKACQESCEDVRHSVCSASRR